MAKHPAPGRAKTRLAAAIGAPAAVSLSRAFIRDLATRLAALPYAVTWAYWPRGVPFRALLGGLPAGWRCRLQRGRDLGERMTNWPAGAAPSWSSAPTFRTCPPRRWQKPRRR